ncbi:hypothetical protein CB0940_00227 [Cercospora beticola]|uniref:Uncharacterized protein n=1 Tax=Cercospora beticola TaxID=122368 RepID=A0A2G5I8D4_CERBT|nr:hypothetical protein CB0940_00227 [Cercospora beticola]PIB01002.1 hypothetical protein CB0940_00227 [Cercospora beticola]WPA95633.1 hypothetical protein RHO25_000236 [Cercospora beticola]CAK1356129.1 unnamed protein product [Cercospora beticola]
MHFTSLLTTTLAFFTITNAIPVDSTLDAREIQLLEAREADPNLFGAIAKIATKLKPGKSTPAWKPDLSKVMLGQKTKDRLRLNGPSRV